MSRSSKKQSPAMPVRHLGVFRHRINLWQAVALIVSGTIGAGVLGIPYAIASIGLIPGLIYLALIGLAMMGLNLLLGGVCIRTKQELQWVGLAKKYLGTWGEVSMMILFYVSLLAVLLIYIIGIGETLTALFGWQPFYWSTIFFVVATLLIILGMRTIKSVEMLLTLGILAVIVLVGFWAAPHQNAEAWTHMNVRNIFFPYGILLFAFNATFAIPEAHQLLVRKNIQFKRAIILSSGIVIALYALFAIAVVGVTGVYTTEIATIGLGEAIGPHMIAFGNLFALLTMGTSYLLVGLSLRDSLRWDFHAPGWLATTVTAAIPFTLFVLGVNQFIEAVSFVGGVLVSLELILCIAIYLRARRMEEAPAGRYRLRHATPLVALLLAMCTLGALSSIVGML